MPVAAHYNSRLECQVFECSGTIYLADMMGPLLSWYESPGFRSTSSVLCDFRLCDWMPMYQEFSRLNQPVAERINQSQTGGRVAFVLRDRIEVAMMDFIGTTHTWAMAWKSFEDLDAAKAWLTDTD